MPPILIDTVFVIALINRRDKYHVQALKLAEEYSDRTLIITHAILLEIGNALARQYKQEAVAIIDQFLNSQDVEIIELTPNLFAQALALYKQYQDKEWGLVDCVSFVVMTEKGLTQALTFDKHFSQAGFTALFRSL